MVSNRAACVFAGARFISSIKIILEKIGPFLNSNSAVFTLNIDVPKISLGIKSGVNCILLKAVFSVFAKSLAVTVFAIPGTPSISTCPFTRRETISSSIKFSCPIMTLESSVLIPVTALFKSSNGILLSKLKSSVCGTSLFSICF